VQKHELYSLVKDKVNGMLEIGVQYDDDQMREIIDSCAMKAGSGQFVSFEMKKNVADGIFNSMRRLDILQPLIDDPDVSEIMVNGIDCVYAERNGKMCREEIKFDSEEKLFNII
jgi:pilus assembly protein CpaF